MATDRPWFISLPSIISLPLICVHEPHWLGTDRRIPPLVIQINMNYLFSFYLITRVHPPIVLNGHIDVIQL